jgi:hypothetical protein
MASYMMWFDDDRKKSVTIKIEEALLAYERRFRRQPNVVLVSEREQVDAKMPVQLRTQSYIRPSHFYVGFEDAA